MAEEKTLAKYKSQEGEWVKITRYSGMRKGVSILDEDKQLTSRYQITRFFPVDEIRIYEDAVIVSRLPVEEIPQEILPELGERLEALALSGADCDEVNLFIPELSENFISQSDGIRDLLNIA